MLTIQQRFYLTLLLAFAFSGIHNLTIALTLFVPFLVVFLYQKYQANELRLATKFLLFINIFSALLWLTMRFKWQNGWQYSAEGEYLALLIIAKMNLITLMVRISLQNFSELQLIQVLQHRWIPAKFTHLAILTLRYIKIFAETHRSLEKAMQARGFQVGCNKRTIYVISQRITLLLIHALHKAKNVDKALRARGFSYEQFNRKHND